MDAVKWTDAVSAVSSAASVVATVGVAVVVHRLDRAQKRREKAEAIRDAQLKWSSQMGRSIDSKIGPRPDQGVPGEPAVVGPLKAQGVDTGRVEAQDALLRGHLGLLDIDPKGQGTWAKTLNEQPTIEEAIEMAVNGSLDVVKDYVLKDTLSTESDYDWVDDGLFEELEQPELVNERVAGSGGRTSDELVASGIKHWVRRGAPQDVRVRIETLLRYKVQLEGMLRVYFLGEFSDGATTASRQHSEKYASAIRSLTRSVKEELDRQAEHAIMTFQDRD